MSSNLGIIITQAEVAEKSESQTDITEQDIADKINKCTREEKDTALKLLYVYVDSLK